MILEIINHKYQYETEKLTRIFYPNEKINVVYTQSNSQGELRLRTVISQDTVSAELFGENGLSIKKEEKQADASQDRELILAGLVFSLLSAYTGYTPEWGILTGIRPSKLLRSLKERSADEGIKAFHDIYRVSDKKILLADSVAQAEERIIKLSSPKSFSLYVSIPFCPTRCSYCSFVSHDMSAQTVKKLMPEYIESLVKEIYFTGEIVKELGLRLETVYFGGGTPTTLTAGQIKTLLDAIEKTFDLSTLREYTVEAGRPDTVTREKLRVLKGGGVTRISINPQSFSDSVLEAIGRRHTSQMTLDAFYLAREEGFDNINTDLIAGLPTDTAEGYRQSLLKALSLEPENITVHTLALKRASHLGEEGRVQVEKSRECSEMLDYSFSTLCEAGYHPYYMYRQSKTLGNLENTGYCKQGKECLYNIFMMEECHSVLAVGAGGVTRLKAPSREKIDRIFNYKYPYEYIKDFDSLLERKRKISEFYNENN